MHATPRHTATSHSGAAQSYRPHHMSEGAHHDECTRFGMSHAGSYLAHDAETRYRVCVGGAVVTPNREEAWVMHRPDKNNSMVNPQKARVYRRAINPPGGMRTDQSIAPESFSTSRKPLFTSVGSASWALHSSDKGFTHETAENALVRGPESVFREPHQGLRSVNQNVVNGMWKGELAHPNLNTMRENVRRGGRSVMAW